MSKTIAIIGAGITGLTTAFKLEQAGFEIVLYEASGHAGGQIRTHQKDGYLVENGPHTLLGRDALPDLVDELGLGERLRVANKQAPNRFLVRYGQPKAAPMSFKSFLKTDILSPLAKLRLLVEPFIGKGPDQEENLAEFITRRLGREPLEFGVGPMVAGTFAGDPSKLSVEHAFPKLYQLEQEHGSLTWAMIKKVLAGRKTPASDKTPRPDLVSFDSGSQVLSDALLDHIDGDTEFGATVFALQEKDNGRWKLRFRQNAKRRQKTVDAVVCTVPAHRLAEIDLDTPTKPDSFAPLGEIYYAPVSVMALGFRRDDIDHPLDGFGMLIPREERRNILGTLFMSSLFKGRAPKGEVLLTSFIGGARQPELALEDRDTLVEKTLADLDELLGVNGGPVFSEHIVWKKAIPQYEVGYSRFQDAIHRIESAHKGIYLAGSYRNSIAVPDLITAAYDLAERISQDTTL